MLSEAEDEAAGKDSIAESFFHSYVKLGPMFSILVRERTAKEEWWHNSRKGSNISCN